MQATDPFVDARRLMVEQQLLARGIQDQRVIEAMLQVPRHAFVREEFLSIAYHDTPLPTALEQTISQPYMVALMSEALEVEPDDRVLEIGTGSGYQTAILACLAREVYTIERHGVLQKGAIDTLTKLGYHHIRFHLGNGTYGWKQHALYDRIIVTAAARHIPETLWTQLKEGGIMVIPVGGSMYQELIQVTRVDGQKSIRQICACRFVPLIDSD
jgi:protein-L-isoaspartate(D-aspartate) O-methyltransferase